MPIDLHKLVANYLRKIHISQYLKAISCLMGGGGGGEGGSDRGKRGGTQVLKLYRLVRWDRTWLSRCSAHSKGYPFWHCYHLVR